MSAQVAEYEGLLQDLSDRVSQEDHLLIQATLSKVRGSSAPGSSVTDSRVKSVRKFGS